MSMELDSMFSKVESIREQWNRIYQRLNELVGSDGNRLDTGKELPGVPFNTAEVRVRILRAFDLVLGLRDSIPDSILPATMVSDLDGSINQFLATVQDIGNQLSNLDGGGGIGALNPENFVLTSKNAASSMNLGKLLRSASMHIDVVLTNYYRIASSVLPQHVTPPTSGVSEIARLLQEVERHASDVRQLKGLAEQERAALGQARTEVEAVKAEIDRFRSESEQSRRSIGEYEADATQKLAQVKAVATEAERLTTSVKNYQPEFERFQTELGQREQWFGKAKQDESDLVSRLNEKENEIGRLNAAADAMLKGATVSGLASSFGEIRDKITTELTWARWGFYLAVGILFLSVLPLAVYVIPGLSLFGLLRGSTSVGDFELGQVLIRALLLVPSAWLAKFAAARHATLFRLREHYAYKYSIAASVEGFKKQAPTLQDEIAAAAFRELTFNPADRMDSKSQESAHPNPVVDWIMRKLGATHDGERS